MASMNREQLDKLISDHFMYEATDDIEGVLRTFTEDADHELSVDRMVHSVERLNWVASTRDCFRISKESVSSR